MNPGGEPERDDKGLPPVDIEIPDDARDLDRDVQAYHRELRALRRSERQGRWHRSLSKDGVVLPLLACCLVLALITGTLLTVFTATSGPSLNGAGVSPPPAAPGAPVALMVKNQPLPDATIGVDGSAIPMQTLDEAMLVLVPINCGCAGTFRWLAEVASKADVPSYVIYSSATKNEVGQLYGQLDRALRPRVRLAVEVDNQNLLSPSSGPAGIPPGHLTAILLGPNSLATWATQLSPRESEVPLVQVLTGT